MGAGSPNCSFESLWDQSAPVFLSSHHFDNTPMGADSPDFTLRFGIDAFGASRCPDLSPSLSFSFSVTLLTSLFALALSKTLSKYKYPYMQIVTQFAAGADCPGPYTRSIPNHHFLIEGRVPHLCLLRTSACQTQTPRSSRPEELTKSVNMAAYGSRVLCVMYAVMHTCM